MYLIHHFRTFVLYLQSGKESHHYRFDPYKILVKDLLQEFCRLNEEPIRLDVSGANFRRNGIDAALPQHPVTSLTIGEVAER